MLETVRRLIDEKANLSLRACDLAPDGDLYRAGLTPFAAIQLMLAIEKEFEVEFPRQMLNRQSMSSISRIVFCIRELQEGAAPLRAA
ncbi:MAG: acyl carrier protein [Methylocystaceae bacterium]|nr:MAG: acyl carrier protein [Methylocystaceae bacterium]